MAVCVCAVSVEKSGMSTYPCMLDFAPGGGVGCCHLANCGESFLCGLYGLGLHK